MSTENRFEVSDEALSQAAIAFVVADAKKKEATKARRDTFNKSTCAYSREEPQNGVLEPPDSCYSKAREGRSWATSSPDWCSRCSEVIAQSIALYKIAGQRNGKLRRLRNLVKKRLEPVT